MKPTTSTRCIKTSNLASVPLFIVNTEQHSHCVIDDFSFSNFLHQLPNHHLQYENFGCPPISHWYTNISGSLFFFYFYLGTYWVTSSAHLGSRCEGQNDARFQCGSGAISIPMFACQIYGESIKYRDIKMIIDIKDSERKWTLL